MFGGVSNKVTFCKTIVLQLGYSPSYKPLTLFRFPILLILICIECVLNSEEFYHPCMFFIHCLHQHTKKLQHNKDAFC